jgi:iturin family lipopeptide synthetase A
MIPSHLAQIDRLPLTVNGKVDTRALPLPEQVRLASASERVLPGNEVESRLADIWGRILGISAEKISMKDDFFTLGGSSMEATRLIGQVQQEFGVKLQLKDIFFEQTLESIASVVSTMLSAGEITDPVNKEVARFTY